MESAIKQADVERTISEPVAIRFRDGLLIAFMVENPSRRGVIQAARIGNELVRINRQWRLLVPADHTKTSDREDDPISERLSPYLDLYLTKFRKPFPKSHSHDGLWPSLAGRPMHGKTIMDIFKRQTRRAFGQSICPHRARNAAINFMKMHDTENFDQAQDIIDHLEPRTTEGYSDHDSLWASREVNKMIERIRCQLQEEEFSCHRSAGSSAASDSSGQKFAK